jgi:hypothetical protein
MTPIETDQKRILEIQKELIAAILDYQIAYGTESISGWNVNVGFNIAKGMVGKQ